MINTEKIKVLRYEIVVLIFPSSLTLKKNRKDRI